MAKTPIRSFTAEAIRDALQAVGFRAEITTGANVAAGAVIRSASNGLAFEVRLFNPSQADTKSFADVTFTAGLQMQGVLAPDIVNRWNAGKRFSRLYIAQGFLVLAMDVLLQGGVAPEYFRAQIEVWDRLLQELLAYLRSAAREQAPKKLREDSAGSEDAAPAIESAAASAPTLPNGHAGAMATDAPGAEPLETAPRADDREAARQP